MGSDGAVSGWLVSGCMLSLGVLLEYVAHVRFDLDLLDFSISLTSLTAVTALGALLSLCLKSSQCAPRRRSEPDSSIAPVLPCSLHISQRSLTRVFRSPLVDAPILTCTSCRIKHNFSTHNILRMIVQMIAEGDQASAEIKQRVA